MRLTVTHGLNVHFVDADAPGHESFEHDGVLVTINSHIPSDGAFASISCTGVTEVFQDGSRSDSSGSITTSGGERLIVNSRFLAPPGMDPTWDSGLETAFHRAEAVLEHVAALIRWRFNLSGTDSLFSSTSVRVESPDGHFFDPYPMPTVSMGDDRAPLGESELAEVTGMATSNVREPLAHQLLREAWNLRLTNPRSSLVIGVSAAEVGMKYLIAALVPQVQGLVEELPSPPLDKMMAHVLPDLPIKADVDPKRRSPKHLRVKMKAAVEARNRVVHRGATPDVFLRDTLGSIREFLYLLDYYNGHVWALTKLSNETIAALGIDSLAES